MLDFIGVDYNLYVVFWMFFYKIVVDVVNSKGFKLIYWDIVGQMFDWNMGVVMDVDNLCILVGGVVLLLFGILMFIVFMFLFLLGVVIGSMMFLIMFNVVWMMMDNQLWIIVILVSGFNNVIVMVIVMINIGMFVCSGIVIVVGGGIICMIIVNQSGVIGIMFDIYQVESGMCVGGVIIDSNYVGFNGIGFVNFLVNGGMFIFNNVDGNGGGMKVLQICYVLGVGNVCMGMFIVNGFSMNIMF